jgi:hypothetical protein
LEIGDWGSGIEKRDRDRDRDRNRDLRLGIEAMVEIGLLGEEDIRRLKQVLTGYVSEARYEVAKVETERRRLCGSMAATTCVKW